MPAITPHAKVAPVLARLKVECNSEDSELLDGGRLLPERKLMEVLGVGRGVLRQALEAMEVEGLIVRRQGQGTFMRGSTAESGSASKLAVRTSPAEILEVRRGIEPLLARLAATRATALMIDRMRHLIDRGGKSKSGREYEKWDTELHTEIARASNNHLYPSLFETVTAVRNEQGWSSLRDTTFSSITRDHFASQHRDIVEAIADRNSEAAEHAMKEHLREVTSLFGV